jgi:hypothetical protein
MKYSIKLFPYSGGVAGGRSAVAPPDSEMNILYEKKKRKLLKEIKTNANK